MDKFAQLRLLKFDGVVTGTISCEEPDRDGEVFDYDSSKPRFQAWADSVRRDSQGQSYGNVRLQHNPSKPVGKLTRIQFDDANKTIKVEALILDEEAKKLLQAGVLTGFSIGGAYAKKWRGRDGLTHYTAEPGEVSLVDRPAVPGATFDLVHADGRHELRKFTQTVRDPRVDQITKMVKAGFLPSQVSEVLRLPLGEVYRLAYGVKRAK